MRIRSEAISLTQQGEIYCVRRILPLHWQMVASLLFCLYFRRPNRTLL